MRLALAWWSPSMTSKSMFEDTSDGFIMPCTPSLHESPLPSSPLRRYL